jgi:hypothetical protein
VNRRAVGAGEEERAERRLVIDLHLLGAEAFEASRPFARTQKPPERVVGRKCSPRTLPRQKHDPVAPAG